MSNDLYNIIFIDNDLYNIEIKLQIFIYIDNNLYNIELNCFNIIITYIIIFIS